ncbi:MAG: hypothetical protein HYY85_22425, partial [Deltaproteobacteria bacterium]|nr:hypothetical protein [Deltaproteobacteria bacterium]
MPAQPEVLCVTCRHFSPALEPSIRQALFGFCAKWEWPFTLTLTEGVTECELYERAAKPVAMAAETGPGERAAAAAVGGQRRIEFYYSTREKPGEQYPCN